MRETVREVLDSERGVGGRGAMYSIEVCLWFGKKVIEKYTKE